MGNRSSRVRRSFYRPYVGPSHSPNPNFHWYHSIKPVFHWFPDRGIEKSAGEGSATHFSQPSPDRETPILHRFDESTVLRVPVLAKTVATVSTTEFDNSAATAQTKSPLTRVAREVAITMTQMAAGRPRTDVEPQYVKHESHSSKQITHADTYTVQNVLCTQSGESSTVFHPLKSRRAAADRGKETERERGQPVHQPLLPQTGHDVIRLPVDRAPPLPIVATLRRSCRLFRCRRFIHH